VAIRGEDADYAWRVYVQHQNGKTCVSLAFYRKKDSTAGMGGKCQDPPLDFSESEDPRILFGLVTPEAAVVRVEHVDGSIESFDDVAAAGYAEKFYAMRVGATPITRVVAVDSNGHTVAERTDVTTLN